MISCAANVFGRVGGNVCGASTERRRYFRRDADIVSIRDFDLTIFHQNLKFVM